MLFFAPNQTNPNKPDFKNARSQNEITPKAWNTTDWGVNPGKTIRLFQLNPNGVAHIILWSHPFRVRFVGGRQNRGLRPAYVMSPLWGFNYLRIFHSTTTLITTLPVLTMQTPDLPTFIVETSHCIVNANFICGVFYHKGFANSVNCWLCG